MNVERSIVIAEAGVNHNGDVRIAKKLIDAAANAGADFVKFQTFSADRIASISAGKAEYQTKTTDGSETQREMLRKLELSSEMHESLIKHCKKRSIEFLSTGFDIESVDYLLGLGQKVFKIPSGEINNLPFLQHIGALKKEIIMSTGMATLGEVGDAIDELERAGARRDRITLLHCTSEYPAPMADVNLRAMQSMRSAFGLRVGYSDHTVGIAVPIAAVALGAVVIEKHITLDRDLPGPDQMASIEPYELIAMVEAIRNIEIALGDGVKRITASEAKNRGIARKSLVAKVPILEGEVYGVHNVSTKRPGTGINPMRWDEVIGRRAPKDFDCDELIEL